MTWLLVRAVPRVAPLYAPLVSATLLAGYVLAAPSAPTAALRLRIAGAVVAATACFVLDDEAAATVGSAPVSRLRQRAVRAGTAAAFVVAWLGVVIGGLHARVGLATPSAATLAEVGALMLIGLAVSCVAAARSDDGRGGVTGAIVALACFATAYLPPRWWWPLTAQAEVTRLAVIAAAALTVALAASADPARRRRWLG